MNKLTFTMSEPDAKKHSTKFNFEAAEPGMEVPKGFKPQFYVPAPFLDSKRIRVTIEELE